MLFGFEVEPLTERQEAEPEVAELKMLRFSLGMMKMDKIEERADQRDVLETTSERPD